MSHINKTPAGSFRANWRDPSGRQLSKTFNTKKEASAFLAEIESSINRGTYVAPNAGKVKFGAYAREWLDSRNSEVTTSARDKSVMENHVIAEWGGIPIAKIDHSSVQAWVTRFGDTLSPATVTKCYHLFSAVLRAAVRDRLIGHNPSEDIRLPQRRRKDTDDMIIAREDFGKKLLPEIPDRYKALVALAAGTGLRWGECVGLRLDAIGYIHPTSGKTVFDDKWATMRKTPQLTVRIVRVAVEVAGTVSHKPYPKSRAGRRVVPLPPFAATLLREHLKKYPPNALGEIFTNTAGGPLRRTLFRSRVWRPALVRGGLLGKVIPNGEGAFLAVWSDDRGLEQTATFVSEKLAVAHVAKHAANGLRFHDLRHSYATWLISDGVPVNDVARILGHEQISTTLNLYTHSTSDRHERVLNTFADFSLTSIDGDESENEEDPSEEGS